MATSSPIVVTRYSRSAVSGGTDAGRSRTESAGPATHGVRPSKNSSSLVGKWLKTVWTATSARRAMSAIVTCEKCCSANIWCATVRIASRVCAFLRARRSFKSPTVRA
ncbi:hypothetical protein MVA48_14725 [Blastococcus sp. PRF04-17]|nr:hypothetical protein [Blastococcus sp. PRF04-17]UOY00255.1 hypothetical protein MVA48_14725 [Blastococcus sp. PRF04-17]